MKLNHVANRLEPRHFETVVEMLKAELGFVELRRTERAIWLRQPGFSILFEDADDRFGTRLAGVMIGLAYVALVVPLAQRRSGRVAVKL